jgi:hypothetical protein
MANFHLLVSSREDVWPRLYVRTNGRSSGEALFYHDEHYVADDPPHLDHFLSEILFEFSEYMDEKRLTAESFPWENRCINVSSELAREPQSYDPDSQPLVTKKEGAVMSYTKEINRCSEEQDIICLGVSGWRTSNGIQVRSI